MARRTFEDIALGERFLVGRATPSRAEAIELARRFEPQPHHVDEEAARASIYGGLTLCSLHLFAVVTRLFFDMRDPIAVLAMLGKDEVRLPAPARPDEELAYWTECVAKRPSQTKPDRGIVVLADSLQNPRGEAVLTQQVTLLVARREASERAG
ncbi:MAG TPA: MaoC/PaaZ C-terminal domain-containing protein [Candidatus Binatia bacterium]|nr:MaoC/PaaZ C-terminal domain-containing protein [Candidatus Binatia bacterium]